MDKLHVRGARIPATNWTRQNKQALIKRGHSARVHTAGVTIVIYNERSWLYGHFMVAYQVALKASTGDGRMKRALISIFHHKRRPFVIIALIPRM